MRTNYTYVRARTHASHACYIFFASKRGETRPRNLYQKLALNRTSQLYSVKVSCTGNCQTQPTNQTARFSVTLNNAWWVCLAANCGVQSPFIRAMGCRYLRCATSVTAGQYAASIVNRCWSGFPCKWRYINVETFNLFNLYRANGLLSDYIGWTIGLTD